MHKNCVHGSKVGTYVFCSACVYHENDFFFILCVLVTKGCDL